MGADPPWLAGAIATGRGWADDLGGDEGIHIARAAVQFANAQPPSEAEINAALAGWAESIRQYPSDVGQNVPNHMRAALIAAAKARSGA